jgi:hypothetical protein
MTIEDKINEFIKNKSKVFIYHNNDTGDDRWLYSVQALGTEFWMYSAEKEEDAVKFCNDNGLEIVDE